MSRTPGGVAKSIGSGPLKQCVSIISDDGILSREKSLRNTGQRSKSQCNQAVSTWCAAADFPLFLHHVCSLRLRSCISDAKNVLNGQARIREKKIPVNVKKAVDSLDLISRHLRDYLSVCLRQRAETSRPTYDPLVNLAYTLGDLLAKQDSTDPEVGELYSFAKKFLAGEIPTMSDQLAITTRQLPEMLAKIKPEKASRIKVSRLSVDGSLPGLPN